MATDAVVGAETEAHAEIMGAIENGPVDRFVLADVTQDGAYITLPLGEAVSLPAWR